MSKKRKPAITGEGFPYCEAPSTESFYGQPESCFDLVNMYGTYEVQRTQDTDNVFPLIAQGLPKSKKDMVITRDDVDHMPGKFPGEERP